MVLTSAKIGTTNAISVPSVPTIAGLASTAVGIDFPGSAGAKGSSATLTLAGTYSGGAIAYTAQVTLP